MNKQVSILLAALSVLVVGVAAFYGGLKYDQHKASTAAPTGNGGGFMAALQNIPANERQQVQQDLQNATSPQARQQVLQKYGIQVRGMRGNFPGGPVAGQIISADDKSITVKLSDGSTKIVYFSGSTTIMTEQKAASSDLTTGKQVQVNGSANSDGSMTAMTIRLQSSS